MVVKINKNLMYQIDPGTQRQPTNRKGETHSWGRTACGRRRVGVIFWMEVEASAGIRGGLEGQARVIGGWSSVDKVE